MTVERKRTYWKIGIGGASVILVALFLLLHDTLFPLFVAFALAYACTPLADALERRGVSRTITALALLAALAGLLGLFIGIVVPSVIDQMHGFLQDLPELATHVLSNVSRIAARFSIHIPATGEALIAKLKASSSDASVESLSPMVMTAQRIVTRAGTFLIGFLDLLIIPIFFFYSLRDFHRAQAYVFDLVPPRRRAYVRSLFTRIDGVLSGYIRGQLLVASMLALTYGTALPLMGIRFGLFIGILAGFLNVVPYLGQLTGASLALIMALVDFSGTGQLIGLVVLFGTVNFIEGHFVTPKIVGEKVGLSPLWAIIALIVGGRAGGLAGMLLAIPVAGTLKVIFEDVLDGYRRSEYFSDRVPMIAGSHKKG
jgi:predicted PurR-regulated permease PerM